MHSVFSFISFQTNKSNKIAFTQTWPPSRSSFLADTQCMIICPFDKVLHFYSKLFISMTAVVMMSLLKLNFQVLESCVKNCGQRFHQEIGKYRFLNELIKLLSPKVNTSSFSLFHIFIVSTYYHFACFGII